MCNCARWWMLTRHCGDLFTVYVYLKSLCGTPETDATLCVNYITTNKQTNKPTLTIWSTKTCTWMFIEALLRIAKTWKKPRCPSVSEWIINQLVHPDNGILFGPKKWALEPWRDMGETWMHTTKLEKAACCVIPMIGHSGETVKRPGFWVWGGGINRQITEDF